jgi:hypothetical protein
MHLEEALPCLAVARDRARAIRAPPGPLIPPESAGPALALVRQPDQARLEAVPAISIGALRELQQHKPAELAGAQDVPVAVLRPVPRPDPAAPPGAV